jgi:beta-lactamase regulating signal transducer with metallopeptidase domain
MNLTDLQHSTFLQSLGWAIANSLWQAAALWVAYYLVNESYKNASAKFKTNTAIILLSTAFAWFCFTFFDKYFSLQNKIVVDTVMQFYTPSKSTSNIFSFGQWSLVLNKLATALPYLSVAYLLLLVFLSCKLLNCYRYTNFIKTNSLQKPAVEWKLFTERVALHIGITKKIKLWVSHHVDVPATIGFLKPVILIPVASINQLSVEQLEAIILHELSHIKRNDYLINIFISLVETILFFNPFIVLLAKIIKRERENSCDDFVLQYQYDRHSYASALLSLEHGRNINLRLAISATSGKKQLLHRVKRIMEAKNTLGFNYGQKLVALLLITGIICSVAWLSPNNEKKNAPPIIKSDRIALKDLSILRKIGTIISQQNNTKVNDIVVPIQNAITDKETKGFAVIQKKIKNKEIIIKPLLQGTQETSDENIKIKLTATAPKIESLYKPSELKDKADYNFSSTHLKSETANAAALQQFLMTRINSVNFKAHFDFKHFEADVELALVKMLKNLPDDIEHFEMFKKEKLQKLIIKEIKNSEERIFKRPQIKPVYVRNSSAQSLALADSILSKKMVSINNRVRKIPPILSERELVLLTERNKYLQPTKPSGGGFTYTHFNNVPAPNVYPTVNPGATGSVSSKSTTLYAKANQPSKVKNATIIIDGKVLKIPVANKVTAQLIGKTFSIINGDEVIEIQIKN